MNDRMPLQATKTNLFTHFTCLRNTFSYFCRPKLFQLMSLMTENCFLPSGKECQDVVTGEEGALRRRDTEQDR